MLKILSLLLRENAYRLLSSDLVIGLVKRLSNTTASMRPLNFRGGNLY